VEKPESELPATGTHFPDRLELPVKVFDLEGFTREDFRKALAQFQGNQGKASEYLGISRK
jgi:DNA-binding NtrC family response regulator